MKLWDVALNHGLKGTLVSRLFHACVNINSQAVVQNFCISQTVLSAIIFLLNFLSDFSEANY